MDVVTSVRGVPIRLTDERWSHILRSHPEVEPYRSHLLDTIREPDVVLRSVGNALSALRRLTGELHLVVIYREVSEQDGFVLTSWMTTRIERLLKRKVLWTRPQSNL
ncbi:MAG: hypothetical protein IH959_06565 [Chloroflexi bacterium]|nr:hypothetical protein [Chloroflexota bacterium]